MSKAIKTETNGKVEAEVKEVDEVSIEETDVEDVAAAEPAEAASAPPAEEPFSAPYSDEAASAPPPDEAPTHSEAEKVNPAPSEEKAPTHPEVEEVNPTSLAKDAPAIAEVALHEASAILETETVESVTAAAVEAAVAAAAQVRATVVLNDPTMPNDRDVILGEGSAGHKTNLLLQDIIRLHRILWKMHDKPPPTSAHQIQAMAQHIINIIQNGKQLEIAGLKDVPKPFMRSTGRFFGKDAETNEWKMLDDAAIKTIMTEIILDEFKVDDLGPITDTPYKDLKEWITKKTNAAPNEFLPEAKDAILLPVYIESMDKMYEQQQGNKTLFHLASQLVTSYTNSPDKRVEAALSIMKGLDETLESMESAAMSDHPTTTKTTRFLIRKQRDDRSVAWDIMDPASAAEFTLIFVFEVFLEKEIHILTGSVGDASLGFYSGLLAGSDGLDTDTSKPSTVPIVEPTDHDVLFGRGGMTNRYACAIGHIVFSMPL